MNITALIIDDEKKARTLLSTIIREHCPQVTTINEAADLPSGVTYIKEKRPNIVFLDIEMPEYSGLQILEFLDKDVLNFEIVFTTAYSEYAIQAFDVCAIDYLLKPIRPKQVLNSIHKFEKGFKKEQLYQRLQELTHSLSHNSFNKIGLPIQDGFQFINIEDIICMQADGMYSKIYLVKETSFLVSKPLKYFEKILKTHPSFLRPHRSHIININYIKQYSKKDGHYIIMDNGITVSLSKTKKEDFVKIINPFL